MQGRRSERTLSYIRSDELVIISTWRGSGGECNMDYSDRGNKNVRRTAAVLRLYPFLIAFLSQFIPQGDAGRDSRPPGASV